MADLLDVDTLFDLLPIGAYRSLPSGRQLRANRALVLMNGYDNEAEMLAAVGDIATEWYVDSHRREEFVRLLIRDGSVRNFVSEVYRHRTRERIWVSENAHLVRDESGRILFFEGTVEDVTARVVSERRLADSERRFRALTEKAQVATAILSCEGRVLYANPGCERLFGIAHDQFVGSNLFDTMHPDDVAEHRREFAAVQRGENTGEESIARHRRADGTYVYLASLAKDWSDDPAIGGVVVNWRDVTAAVEAEARLRELATLDALTSLCNRREFERVARERLARTERSLIVLLYIDINRFKLVNDSLGHAVGDRVLAGVADRMRRVLEPGQLLARLGGDEFGLLAEVPDRAAGCCIGQRILDVMARPLDEDGLRADLGASVGLAFFPEDASDFAQLLSCADLAMYEAKATPGNRFAVYSPELSRRVREQLLLVNALCSGVERREFIPYYQPVVDLASGEWLGFETLARWQHPERGLIAAGTFVTVAEEHGLIGQIGRQIAAAAIAQLARWHRSGHEQLRLTFNVSAYQLREPGFVGFIAELLREEGVPAHRLYVEMTESALAGADAPSRRAIQQLQASGLRIVVDDIGTGYASFAQLKRFHVDVIKIDRSFIEGLPRRRVDTAIVTGLATMARMLGIAIVAEGIENAAQVEFLRALEVDAGQGLHFAPPLSAEAATEALTRLRRPPAR